jgi:hypothetical protein
MFVELLHRRSGSVVSVGGKWPVRVSAEKSPLLVNFILPGECLGQYLETICSHFVLSPLNSTYPIVLAANFDAKSHHY